MRSAIHGAVLVLTLFRGAAAVACPPALKLPSYWTWTAVVDAGPVPLDGGLLLTARAWPSEGVRPGPEDLAAVARVVVRDGSGRELPGSLVPWNSEPLTVVWRPAEPLPPRADLAFEASLALAVARPAAATGAESLQGRVTTAEAAAAPLQVAGSLNVAVEAYDLPVLGNCTDCGCATVIGSVRALRARVTVPAVEGGYAPEGYVAELWSSTDQPFLPGSGGGSVLGVGLVAARLRAGAPTDILADLPDKDTPYVPCFSVRVRDPAGHSVDAVPVCLASMRPSDTLRRLDGAGGCAVAGRRPAPWLLVLTAVAVAARLRRRR